MEGYAVKSPFGYDVPFGVQSEGFVDEVLPYFSRAVTDGRSASISFSIVSLGFIIKCPYAGTSAFRGVEFVRPYVVSSSGMKSRYYFSDWWHGPLLLCVC